MHLRLCNQQMRFRLTQDELALLQQQGRLDEALPMPLPPLQGFALTLTVDATAHQISVINGILVLALPPDVVNQLARERPSKEGYTILHHTSDGNSFQLMLEIDVRHPKIAHGKRKGSQHNAPTDPLD
jgi:hypothetical protein